MGNSAKGHGADQIQSFHTQLQERKQMLTASFIEPEARESKPNLLDAADDERSDAINFRVDINRSDELQKIHQALARIQAGTYGLCEECVRKIPLSRLNALPYATLCIECARTAEQTRKVMGGN